ncbi:hypothetical protein SAMN06295967_1081 [Belliella buryatensis]|uniref:Uncharacterized protein n=1 Tax=Belliella buryatensis TaxID=1500549 RepID=A0A239DS67_9BACT|nr:hypothetical protein SAMN06295967_1081 [Belliella buryatensis]
MLKDSLNLEFSLHCEILGFKKKNSSNYSELFTIYLKMVCFLSGPTETILIGTPSSSSSKLT